VLGIRDVLQERAVGSRELGRGDDRRRVKLWADEINKQMDESSIESGTSKACTALKTGGLRRSCRGEWRMNSSQGACRESRTEPSGNIG
jgi:hypothetical protein